MIKVVLSKEEIGRGELYNLKKERNRQQNNVPDRVVRRYQSRKDMGVFGEIAVGKHLGVPVDLRAEWHEHMEVDLRYKGMTIDVKATGRIGNGLALDADYTKFADIYLLAVVQLPIVWLVGWASAERLQQAPTRVLAPGRKPVWYVGAKELSKIEEL